MIKIKVLITSIGRRVELIRHFVDSGHYVVGVDASDFNSAKSVTNVFYKVPRYNETGYIDKILDICKRERVDMIIPLFEKEFDILDKHRKLLLDKGIFLMLSNENVLSICNDKWNTYNFFTQNNINTPRSFVQLQEDMYFPLFIKPRDGMGSNNCFKINNKKELVFFYEYIDKPIIQEFVDGTEYTMDCICDGYKCMSIVIRERLEVKSGEVSKSKIVKNDDIKKQTEDLCLKLGAIGPITIQCIVDNQKNVKFTEINPRFGGGVTLSIKSGIEYANILEKVMLGIDIDENMIESKELAMTRYDEAIYYESNNI